MGQSKAERDAAIRKIKDTVCSTFKADGVTPDEVRLDDNGDIIVDRRKRYPGAVPVTVGKWS